ncbi:phosphoribosyltransferase [Microbacterium sp.]|uniref:phosphoribosyltransferase n=1 Tax=Microbacterium sp. TaxID=51671 RepID=UPI002D76CB1D|nr:phosphoribosyltransferase family protein [Microbacterium sp.]HET6300052.1 phosphoribosyltransferase family protein [Microbacterium sp.]
MAIFADRADAGRVLAAALERWRGTDAIVFGIPRGGVVVAAEVARVLSLPLAAVVVRKLGAAHHEEFAVGAIAEDVRLVRPEAVRTGFTTPDELAKVEQREREELARRTRLFGASAVDMAGRTALVVDDGIATGATATVACRSLRARGASSIVLAVPVAPVDFVPEADSVDEYVCPNRIRDFWAVGQFYRDFRQTTDDEVIRLLSASGSGADGSAGTATAGA